jgi:trans-2,3-dihydro-3-hydroxyanthranilate isomerase
MADLDFYIVDVFAEEKYTGNQLAVFRHWGDLSTSQMQAIANETHYSETTFIISEEERDGGYDVRIFTPAQELPFAGHPTLGTAWIIRNEILNKSVEKVVLNLKVGQIPVRFEGDLGWMRQIEPEFGQEIDSDAVADALGLSPDDIDGRFPIEEVSTGVFCMVAPLKNMDAVKRALVDRRKFSALIKGLQARTILIFSPETYDKDNHLNVRFFADEFGIAEDPATGSANGCLAGYLVKNRYFDSDSIDIKVEQGYEIRRPSLLYLKAANSGGEIEVNVGGKVVMTARGQFI